MKLNQATTAKAALTAAAAATLLSLAACGSPSSSGQAPATSAADQETPAASTAAPESTSTAAPSPAASAPAAAAPATSAAKITIKDFKYQGVQTVSPGATIAVTNADIEAHTITADQGSAFDAVIPAGAGTFTAPTKPGTYTYHCNFHGNMKGTLVVK